MNGPDRLDAASFCDRAPVHIPGNIQPHGRLIVLPAGAADTDAPILAASANLEPGRPGAPLPRHLSELLSPDCLPRIADALAAREAAEDPVLEGLACTGGRRWTGLLRRTAGATLLELEPEADADPVATRRILLDLNEAIAALRQQPDAAACCQVATLSLRRITGFDRVMAYRFMADWSGEVLAESLRPEMPLDSYLGLVFPASDIPAPARALYASNRLRLIPDATAHPSPLLSLRPEPAPEPTAPIDLSRAVLRGVAPVHLHYLANMGVTASMSVAIATPTQPLWGLLACHHQDGPLFVDHVRRQAAETIAHALSWRLAELADADAVRRSYRLQAAGAPFLDRDEPLPMPGDRPRPRPGDADAAILLAACDATGLAILAPPGSDLGELGLRIGLLPPEPALRELAGWLDRVGIAEPLLTDRLGTLLPPALQAALDADRACGLLAMPLSERAGAGAAGGWILWFRPELRRQVTWAGHKPDSPDPAVALTPRASFAAWREEVAGRSAAWPDWSLGAAREFRQSVLGAMARQGARVARSNAELSRRNAEIRFFADAATHDLKEPLWQVQVLCGLIRDGLGELFGPDAGSDAPRSPAHEALVQEVADLELLTMSDLIVTSAGRMRAMIDDLARFAVAGRDNDRIADIALRQLADEALQDLGEALRAAPDAVLDLDGLGDVSLRGDASQLRRVFQNLLSNAIKYRDPARPLRVAVTAGRHGDAVRIDIADNGVGFEHADRQTMFEPFRRLQRAGTETVEGLGLGLAICQRIVAAHGGTIEATPLSPGAHFAITVPDDDQSSEGEPS